MKKLILFAAVAIFCLGALKSYADPWVVVAEQTDTDYFEATLNSVAQDPMDYTVWTFSDNNDYCPVLDLAGISEGDYTVTVKAGNIWGESADTSPFFFTKGLPAVPGSIGIKKQ